MLFVHSYMTNCFFYFLFFYYMMYIFNIVSTIEKMTINKLKDLYLKTIIAELGLVKKTVIIQ